MRRSICSETYEPDENYVPLVIEKEESIKQMLHEKLNTIFMFSNLELNEKSQVVDAIQIKEFKKGDKVIVQGDQGDVLYAVGSGELK